MSVRLFACLLLCGAAFGPAQGAAPEPAAARDLWRGLPLRFEPNRGQWNPQVKFLARRQDSRLTLTAREAVISAGDRAVGISLLRSNPAARVEGLDPLPTRASYFLGNDRAKWRAGVEQYSRVRYRDVYPGIDLVYYGDADRLEYDLVLRPGADPARIRMKFRGADRLSLTADGDLLLESGETRLLQKKPVIYQQDGSGARQEVQGRYRLLARNLAGVELAAYDRSRALTIDPALIYSTLVGGGGSDAVTAVKLDPSGAVWIAGYTGTGDLNATDNAFQAASGGGTNIFLAKFDPKAGNALVYFTYIGGSGTDMPNAMAIGASGKVYLTGSTTSSDFPLGGSAFQNMLGGVVDAFVLQLDPSLTGPDQMIYSSYFGGGDKDIAYGIDVDASGGIYVVGTTRSGDLPLTGSAYQNILYGPQDAFVAKFDPTAASTLVYSTYLGGELEDTGRAIAVTPSGTVYAGGSTESTGFPPFFTSNPGKFDCWLVQMDLTKSGDASLVASAFLGGTTLDELRKIAIDPTGKLLVTGYTMSTDFPATPDAYQRTLGGNADAFVARVDLSAPPDSFIKYATYLGGVDGEVGYDVASDRAGNIYVTGYTLSKDFPTTTGALEVAWGGGTEGFITKLNPAISGPGALVYSSFLGRGGQHAGYGIALAADGTLYIGGLTDIADTQITGNAMQGSYGGGLSDGFLIVLGP